MGRPLNKRTLQSAAAATGNGNNLIVEGMGAAAFQIKGTFSATVTFEGIVDEADIGVSGSWIAIRGQNRNTGVLSTTATTTGIWVFNTTGLHAIRARISTYASGSVTVIGREVDPAIAPDVTAIVAGDVAHDAADSGNPVKIGGKASAAAPAAVTEGDRVNASFTLTGSQRVEVAGSTTGTDAIQTQGTAAADAAVVGNPLLSGGRASTAATWQARYTVRRLSIPSHQRVHRC